MQDSILEKARALKRMMDDKSTTENEKQNASNLLSNLLKKHGLSFDDLLEQDMTEIEIKYSRRWEKKLIIQIIGMVKNVNPVEYSRYGTTIVIEGTKVQVRDIQSMYDFYRPQLQEEIETLVEAFMQANSIFPDTNTHEEDNEIDWSFVMRVKRMMESIEPLPKPNKKLLAG